MTDATKLIEYPADVKATIGELKSAFIDVTIHAQQAFKLVALIEQQAARIAALESAAKATVLTYHEYESLLAFATRIEEAQEKPIEVSVHASALLRRLATAPAATDNGCGRDAEWFALADGAAAELEQAAIAITDLDAKRIATSGAAHIRKRCKEMLSKREFK